MRLAKIAIRNIGRNTRRSFLSGLAIAIAALIIVFFFSLAEGMKQDLAYNVRTYLTGDIRIRHEGYTEVEDINPLELGIPEFETVIAAVESIPTVQSVSPRIGFAAQVFLENRTIRAVGTGVDFSRERDFQELPDLLIAGRLPEDAAREVLLSEGLAAELGMGIGQEVTFVTQKRNLSPKAFTLEVVGIVRFPLQQLNRSGFLAPLDLIRDFLLMENSVTGILVKVNRNADPTQTISRLREVLPPAIMERLEIRSWRDIGISWNIIRLADVSYNFIALFFFLLASTVIVNTVMMTIYERTREIGTLAAMGMHRGEIVRLFFLESFAISIAGALAGVLLGILLVVPLSQVGIDFSASMGEVDMDISPILRPVLNLRSTVVVFLFSVTISSLASLIPSRKGARIRPVEALRTE